MNTSVTDKLWYYGNDILNSKTMAIEKTIIQHGTITCYEHSLSVAEKSLLIARHLPIKISEKDLVRGALLHDYFLYDWHENDSSHKLHGFHHAARALANARRDFKLSAIEQDIIRKHMFPLNIRPPKYPESWIVCLADKLCATGETLHRRRNAVIKTPS